MRSDLPNRPEGRRAAWGIGGAVLAVAALGTALAVSARGGGDDPRGGPVTLIGDGGAGGGGKGLAASPAVQRPGEAGVSAPAEEETVPPAVSNTPERPKPEESKKEAPAGSEPPEIPVPVVPPTMEKGSLGEDSRCSVPYQGPASVKWRACARVTEKEVSFALKLINQGRAAARVKVRQQYVQNAEFHACPQAPEVYSLTVPAGGTVITELGNCTVARQGVPVAYQSVGWVFTGRQGEYRLSPNAHVHPDKVIWKPDLA